MSRRVAMVTLMAFALMVVAGGAGTLAAASPATQAAQTQAPPAQAKPPVKPATPAQPTAKPAKPAKPAQKPAPAKPAAATLGIDGKYEGTIETPNGPETGTLELRTEAGTIRGTLSTPSYPGLPLTGGTLTGDQFAATFLVGDMQGALRGTLKGEQIDGTWIVEDSSGAFSVEKVATAATPAAAAPATTPAPAAGAKSAAAPGAAPAGDPLTGDWDAAADAGGTTHPFVLSLKLTGDKVTGSVSSDMGTSPIEGTWSNGTLSFAFTMPDGMGIAMVATLAEGKLTGSFTFGDQMPGGWAASKRK